MEADKLSYSEPLETSSNSFNKADNISVQKETEKQEKSKLLPKINDILDSFSVSEEEDKYRKILLNTPLDILKNTLSWTNVEIKQFLIQAQIDELNKKADLTNSDKELDSIFTKIEVFSRSHPSSVVTYTTALTTN